MQFTKQKHSIKIHVLVVCLINKVFVYHLHVLEYAKLSILGHHFVIKQTKASGNEMTTLIIINIH